MSLNLDHSRTTISVDQKLPFWRGLPLSLQHLFAMFGGSVLVPTLFHIDPSIVLLTNGIGTLIYLFICKGRVPAYLGSSFAFMAPVLAIIAIDQSHYSHALGGFIVVGLLFLITASIVKIWGTNWIDLFLPPAAMGPIVALIGLELAPVAAQMAGFMGKDVNAIIVSSITLATVMVGSIFFRGFWSAIPILIGIIIGYIVAMSFGMVNLGIISGATLLKLPTLYTPVFNWNAIMTIIPVALVVISEHIGHLIVTGCIVEKDLMKNPGLHRSLIGNGVGTVLSGLVGSVPTTTYAENIGVMAITRVYSVWVIGGAAILSIILSFSGTLAALIQTIPTPVIGGVCMLLFGIIVASGIRMLIETKVNYNDPLNLVVTAMTFVVGVSGITIQMGTIPFKGMSLATVVALVMNLFFYIIGKVIHLRSSSPDIPLLFDECFEPISESHPKENL